MAKGYNKNVTVKKFEQRKNLWLMNMLELASSSIYWEGLPESIDLVYLENCLVRTGSAIIMYDGIVKEYTNGQNASVGLIDRYGYPQQRSVIWMNGQQLWGTPEDSVIIYNNTMRCSDLWKFEIFAKDLADYDMAIHVNMNTQKTMPLIPAKLETSLTLDNLYKDMMENVPYHLIDPQSLDIEAFRNALLFDNKKSFTADGMIKVQREYWNRVLTFIGVNNPNVEKAERVNTYETNSNLQEIRTFQRSKIKAREEACKRMKQLWGWNVRVGYYSEREGMGVTQNGGVYNRVEDDFRSNMVESESRENG